MNIKRNITFQLESRKKAGVAIVDNVPIRMRVVFGGKRIEFTTGYRIDVSKWDSAKQRVKNGCSNKLKQSAAEINADLNRYESLVQTIFKEYEIQAMMPTPDDIKALFNERTKIEVSEGEADSSDATATLSFWEVLDLFIEENGRLKSWTKACYQKFNAMKKHLQDFGCDKHFRCPIEFETFTEHGLNRYLVFLSTKLKMLNSTVDNQISFLKWFLRWSYEKNYHKVHDYQSFRPRLKNTQKKIIFLTQEEVAAITNLTIPATKQYLERVRDVLLFCCYTGLRYSDVANLRRSDVKENHIEITTVKTNDSLVIELNRHSRAIIEKYSDVNFKGDKVLPVISNQKMNEYVKELGELAEINTPIRITQYIGNDRIDTIYPKYELLSTHTGRKTFICTALALGIPPHVVMKWTGHSDYKAMKPYIDIADSIKAAAMTKFDSL
ncbi:site-specific integrase [uncultured Bacteroides sp.]|uniref:site-specific integrase n=1 Tax=uncultured Bacteroides sp. TaxID=162156 RepID=UPI00262528CB|nr:site-specific integrase [uncultured Bacteroides sp.]